MKLSIPPQLTRQPDFVRISFITSSAKQKIFPTHWVHPERHGLKNIFKPNWAFLSRKNSDAELAQLIAKSEVGRYLAEKLPHISIGLPVTVKVTMYSLERNKHGRIATGIIFLLLVYTIVDLMAGPESYIDHPPLLTYLQVAAGVVAIVLSGLWLSKSALLSAEKIGLAVMIGVLAAIAMWPGALRINALFDNKGLVEYDCQVIQGAGSVILQPFNKEIPAIDYFATNKYWEKFGKDDLYPVKIRKGVLGFYQFNSAEIVKRIGQDS